MSDIPAPRSAAGSSNLEALLRNARLASGLVMMVFVVTHLINHALNLISLETAEAGRHVFLARVAQSAGHRPALRFADRAFRAGAGGALSAAHAGHAAARGRAGAARAADPAAGRRACRRHAHHPRAVRRQRHLRIRGADACGSRRLRSACGRPSPWSSIWAHGCLGLYFWLRYRRWYPSAAPWLLIVAVLLPVLALLGFAHAGQTVVAMGPPTASAIDPALFDDAIATKDAHRSGHLSRLRCDRRRSAGRPPGARPDRAPQSDRGATIPAGRPCAIPKGYSVLDASRLGGIPHYSVCGGRGRCSTCRVKVIEGLDGQPEAGQIERATLDRISAEDDVRLACQFKPIDDVRVMPLLVPRHEQDQPVAHQIGSTRPRADRRGAVLRHAQLHLDRRPAAAVRHRLPAQPLFRDRRRGGRDGRRPARQVHRRRRHGAVRP